jgi:DNA adenine methylase Dam
MGNKKKLINKGLIDLFPENISDFVDVFAGSAIVSMNTKAEAYYVNDINPHLAQLYELFSYSLPDEIIQHIEDNIDKYGLPQERLRRCDCNDPLKIARYKEAYIKLRDDYNKNVKYKLKCDKVNTLDFYTLMFYSFSQQFRFNKRGEFNMPYGTDCYSLKNEEYIRNGCKFFGSLHTYHFSNDFNSLIDSIFGMCERDTFHIEESFFYFDPPYLNTTATYNENNGWTKDNELTLYRRLNEIHNKGGRWALSTVLECKGKINQYLQEWLKDNDYTVHEFNINYSACGKGNSNAKEILVMNY